MDAGLPTVEPVKPGFDTLDSIWWIGARIWLLPSEVSKRRDILSEVVDLRVILAIMLKLWVVNKLEKPQI